MKLGVIDYQLPRGGVERFILNVLNSLPEDIDVTIYSADTALDGYQALIAQATRYIQLVSHPIVKHHAALVVDGQGALCPQHVSDIPAELYKDIDIAWLPWANRSLLPRECYIRTVATVHDMIAVELGDLMAEKRDLAGRVSSYYCAGMEDMLVRRLSGSLAKVVVDAKRTADHLSRAYGPLPRAPEVIYLAAEHMGGFTAEPIESLGLPPRYLVYPASHHAHKNHEGLFLALALVKAERPDMFLPLVLTGWQTEQIGDGSTYRGAYLKALLDHLKLEVGKDVLLPGKVRDGQFRAILEASSGVVFPTLQEGFGFPPIEAAYFGVPVAVSDIEIMRESLARFDIPAVWFRPDSTEEMAAAMIRLAAEETDLRARAQSGLVDLKGDSWAEVGRRYQAAFREQLTVATMFQQYGGAAP
jgi:glycosyltransferase involved in cell wall biosynthesis